MYPQDTAKILAAPKIFSFPTKCILFFAACKTCILLVFGYLFLCFIYYEVNFDFSCVVLSFLHVEMIFKFGNYMGNYILLNE